MFYQRLASLSSRAYLSWYICMVWGSNPDHHKKKWLVSLIKW